MFVCSYKPENEYRSLQLKPGHQIPSPAELMGKILIKNKKSSHEKPNQTKKTAAAAAEQTAAATASQDPNTSAQDPVVTATRTQETQGGQA